MKKQIILSLMCVFLANGLFLANAQDANVANITFTHDLYHGDISIKFLTSSDAISIDKGNGVVEKVLLTDLESEGKFKIIKFTPAGKTIKLFDNALQRFTCSRAMMTSLDVSNCPKLDNLNCSYNRLTTLDVSKNAALIILSCADNKLTLVSLKDNNKLRSLYVDRNELGAAAIANIFSNLPDRSKLTSKGKVVVFRSHRNEKNSYDAAQASVATDKGWEIVTL